jgi:hypothetical protein
VQRAKLVSATAFDNHINPRFKYVVKTTLGLRACTRQIKTREQSACTVRLFLQHADFTLHQPAEQVDQPLHAQEAA